VINFRARPFQLASSLPFFPTADLFAKVLGPNGLLKGKARVLCTNSVAFLSQTDNLLMLRGGEIVEQSTYEKVRKKNPLLVRRPPSSPS